MPNGTTPPTDYLSLLSSLLSGPSGLQAAAGALPGSAPSVAGGVPSAWPSPDPSGLSTPAILHRTGLFGGPPATIKAPSAAPPPPSRTASLPPPKSPYDDLTKPPVDPDKGLAMPPAAPSTDEPTYGGVYPGGGGPPPTALPSTFKGAGPYAMVPRLPGETDKEYSDLILANHYESGGRNIPNWRWDATHTAEGPWQITHTNWKRFAPGMDIRNKDDPSKPATRPMEASDEDQHRVALALYRADGFESAWGKWNPRLREAVASGMTYRTMPGTETAAAGGGEGGPVGGRVIPAALTTVDGAAGPEPPSLTGNATAPAAGNWGSMGAPPPGVDPTVWYYMNAAGITPGAKQQYAQQHPWLNAINQTLSNPLVQAALKGYFGYLSTPQYWSASGKLGAAGEEALGGYEQAANVQQPGLFGGVGGPAGAGTTKGGKATDPLAGLKDISSFEEASARAGEARASEAKTEATTPHRLPTVAASYRRKALDPHATEQERQAASVVADNSDAGAYTNAQEAYNAYQDAVASAGKEHRLEEEEPATLRKKKAEATEEERKAGPSYVDPKDRGEIEYYDPSDPTKSTGPIQYDKSKGVTRPAGVPANWQEGPPGSAARAGQEKMRPGKGAEEKPPMGPGGRAYVKMYNGWYFEREPTPGGFHWGTPAPTFSLVGGGNIYSGLSDDDKNDIQARVNSGKDARVPGTDVRIPGATPEQIKKAAGEEGGGGETTTPELPPGWKDNGDGTFTTPNGHTVRPKS